MKSGTIFFVAIINTFMLLSFKNDAGNNCGVFLSMDYKNKITLYSTATKQRVIKQMGHNFSEEDYLLFTIYNSNDSMYYVEASYAIAGKNTKGWISKKTKLSVFSKAYNKKMILYKSYSKKSAGVSIDYISKELEVLNCHDGWLKVAVTVNKKIIFGWLPPEEQCSNPYTTCN